MTGIRSDNTPSESEEGSSQDSTPSELEEGFPQDNIPSELEEGSPQGSKEIHLVKLVSWFPKLMRWLFDSTIAKDKKGSQPSLFGHVVLSLGFIVIVLTADRILRGWLDENKKDNVWFTPPSEITKETLRSSAKNVVDQYYTNQALKTLPEYQKIQDALDLLAKKGGQEPTAQELKVLFIKFIDKYTGTQTTQTTQQLKLRSESERLIQQFDQIESREKRNYTLMFFFYRQNYIALAVMSVCGSITILCLFFISKSGWEGVNNAIINIFLVSSGCIIFYGNLSTVFQQERNYESSRLTYIRYGALRNEFLSYFATRETKKIEINEPSQFINHIDSELNTIALEEKILFDKSSIPDVTKKLNDMSNQSNDISNQPNSNNTAKTQSTNP